MAERPILFSGPMVRAILEGRKSQTRRVVKLPPAETPWRFDSLDDFAYFSRPNRVVMGHEVVTEGIGMPYAHGRPGDLLWVKETFAHDGIDTIYAADCEAKDLAEERKLRRQYPGISKEFPGGPWKPSIFMPRRLSRLTLRITNVRVERLQEISITDAMAEGVYEDSNGIRNGAEPGVYHTPAGAYQGLWESINGEGSWDANPWVWVIEFERVESAKAAA